MFSRSWLNSINKRKKRLRNIYKIWEGSMWKWFAKQIKVNLSVNSKTTMNQNLNTSTSLSPAEVKAPERGLKQAPVRLTRKQFREKWRRRFTELHLEQQAKQNQSI